MRSARGCYLQRMNGLPSAAVFTRLDDVVLQDAPIEPTWVLAGAPLARSGCHSINTDRWASTHVWACSAGRFRWHFELEETVLILEGEVIVTDDQGRTQRLTPGTVAYFPTDSWWVWDVPEHVRKLAFNRRSMLWPGRVLSRGLSVLLRPLRRRTGAVPG
jgi:uncharacterized cupin superfamily protein